MGRLCVYVRILSAYLPFCQRISRRRQAEARVFIIMWPDPRERGRVARCHSQLPHESWPIHFSSIGFPGVAAASSTVVPGLVLFGETMMLHSYSLMMPNSPSLTTMLDSSDDAVFFLPLAQDEFNLQTADLHHLLLLACCKEVGISLRINLFKFS